MAFIGDFVTLQIIIIKKKLSQIPQMLLQCLFAKWIASSTKFVLQWEIIVLKDNSNFYKWQHKLCILLNELHSSVLTSVLLLA